VFVVSVPPGNSTVSVCVCDDVFTEGVTSGAEGLNSRTEGVNSGAEGVNSGH
jgi:hypothetical protein